MRKVLIFGNSGSGKSTLAKQLSRDEHLPHLDLDTLAWQPTTPPVRTPLAQSQGKILRFIEQNTAWVIEGCYADLLALIADHANEIIYMDLSVEHCQANAKKRPWESHKYPSKSAQDANLDMLVDWIAQYPTRGDATGQAAHQAIYNDCIGIKQRITKNNSE